MKNNKNKHKRRRINLEFLIFCAVILVVISFFASRGFKREALYDEALTRSQYKQTDPMDIVPVTQYFFATDKTISGVEIMSGFSGRNEDGTLKVEFLNSAGDTITESSIPFGKIKDGEFTRIKFKKKIELIPDEEYCIRLSQDSDVKGEGLKYYYTPSEARNLFKEASVTKNGSLVMNTLTKKFHIIRFVVCLILVMAALMGFVILLDRIAQKKRAERIKQRRRHQRRDS